MVLARRLVQLKYAFTNNIKHNTRTLTYEKRKSTLSILKTVIRVKKGYFNGLKSITNPILSNQKILQFSFGDFLESSIVSWQMKVKCTLQSQIK